MALARALAIEPRILLLDEPFGALDAKVRKDLRRWLRDLHRRLGLTSVFVTHDQEEALELADQVVLMREGRIEQIGSPREIYDRPATPFVYEFLGSANRLPCRVRAGLVDVAGGRFDPPYGVGIADGAAMLFVRPHDLAVEPAERAEGMPATLTSAMTTGPTFRLRLKLEQAEAEVEAEMAKSASTRSGSPREHRSGCARWSSACSPQIQGLPQPLSRSRYRSARRPSRNRLPAQATGDLLGQCCRPALRPRTV